MPSPPPPGITSIQTLTDYLASHSTSAPTSITPLTGGTANFVFRLIDLSGFSKIVKHASPYIAASQGRVPFPAERMDYEVTALRTIGALMMPQDDSSSRVKIPRVLEYDGPSKVLTMTDGGSMTLKAAYASSERDTIADIGDELGRWLARLHHVTKDTNIGPGGNEIGKRVYRWAYSHLWEVAAEFKLDVSFCRSIDEKYGSLLLATTDDASICHGDFWPGNVLLDDHDRNKLTVVDWEMCRRGCGATDVGQFAAEAYLLDRLRGGKGLLEAFLRGYRQGAEGLGRRSLLEDDDDGGFVQRVAVHMGVHLAYWPARVDWGIGKEETREIVELGHEVMRRGDAGDVGSLREGMLSGLLG